MTTERDFSKELCYNYYRDFENGNDTETIDYPCLFGVLRELCNRIEQLEQKLNKPFDKEDFNYQCYVEDYK